MLPISVFRKERADVFVHPSTTSFPVTVAGMYLVVLFRWLALLGQRPTVYSLCFVGVVEKQ